MASSIVSGAVFGAAMMAAGIHKPALVIAQMKFETWQMMQTFLAATASSALIYSAAERLGYIKLAPRDASPLGLAGRYDGNVLGGALLGAGMTLAGSCPGTVYVQLAAGMRTGVWALAGAVAGGILWAGVLGPLVRRPRSATADARPVPVALDELLGLSRPAALLLLETTCVAVVAATRPRLHAPASGVLIGSAQLVSLLLRRSLIGVSTSYEEVGDWFWWLAGGADPRARPGSCQNVLFAAGVFVGARGILHAVPSLADAGPAPVLEAPPLLAVAGGVLMTVGARMAGGCTSGHGISGISLLSASSIVTITSLFATGAVVAPLVY